MVVWCQGPQLFIIINYKNHFKQAAGPSLTPNIRAVRHAPESATPKAPVKSRNQIPEPGPVPPSRIYQALLDP